MNDAGAQVTAGLVKLSMVLRQQAWQASGQRGLTPTQSQILALVAAQGPGVVVSAVSKALSVTKGTASEAISALERKGLIRKDPDAEDGRVVRLRVTQAGRKEARLSAVWPDLVVKAISGLPVAEQAGFLRGVIGLIRSLQEEGAISASRMCVDCRFFSPNQYPGQDRPHHCHYIGGAIADVDLRVDCNEMEPAEVELKPQLLAALFQGDATGQPPPE